MPNQYNQIVAFTKAVRFKPISFTSVDGTTAKLIFDPDDPASRINFIAVSSTCASQIIATLQVHNTNTGEICPLGTITIPGGAGTNGSVSAVSALNRGNLPWLQIDSDGNPFLDANLNMNLEVFLQTALTGSDKITFTTSAGSYAA